MHMPINSLGYPCIKNLQRDNLLHAYEYNTVRIICIDPIIHTLGILFLEFVQWKNRHLGVIYLWVEKKKIELNGSQQVSAGSNGFQLVLTGPNMSL